MKENHLTKQDIRDLLQEHTERTIKPLIKNDIRELLAEHTEQVIKPLIKQELAEHTELTIKPLIEESANRTTSDLTNVNHAFMVQVDKRFLCIERDLTHMKEDYGVLDRKLAYYASQQ